MSLMNAVTPLQARGHWCPFSRVPAEEVRSASGYSTPSGPSINRSRTSFPACTVCLASRCMAWRWATPIVLRNRTADDPEATEEPSTRPEGVPASWRWSPADPFDITPAGWVEPEAEAAERALGYCSLAGDPVQRQILENLGGEISELTRAVAYLEQRRNDRRY